MIGPSHSTHVYLFHSQLHKALGIDRLGLHVTHTTQSVRGSHEVCTSTYNLRDRKSLNYIAENISPRKICSARRKIWYCGFAWNLSIFGMELWLHQTQVGHLSLSSTQTDNSPAWNEKKFTQLVLFATWRSFALWDDNKTQTLLGKVATASFLQLRAREAPELSTLQKLTITQVVQKGVNIPADSFQRQQQNIREGKNVPEMASESFPFSVDRNIFPSAVAVLFACTLVDVLKLR